MFISFIIFLFIFFNFFDSKYSFNKKLIKPIKFVKVFLDWSFMIFSLNMLLNVD